MKGLIDIKNITNSEEKKKSRYTIQSIKKALMVLKLFNRNNLELSLTEISKLMNLNKSGILRIMETLKEEAFVSENPENKKYRLGISVFNLANYMYESMNIKKISYPYLKNASAQSGLVVHLGILEDNNVLIIEKIWPQKGVESIRMVSKVGGIVPIHCTGIGKLLLAYQNKDEALKILKNRKLTKYTNNTITNKQDLIMELSKIKERGFSTNNCEHEPYIKCVTYPIYDHDCNVIAGMSITGLKDIIDSYDEDKLHRLAKNTTLTISKELGYIANLG